MESVRIRRPETTGPRDSRGPTTLPIPTSDPHATTGLPPERYAELRGAMRDAISTYADEVRDGAYPAEEHTYG